MSLAAAPPRAWLDAVASALRGRDGTRDVGGGELAIRCLDPAAHQHEDRTPSATWNIVKGCGTCHGCGQRWNLRRAADLLGLELPSNGTRPATAWEIRDRSGRLVAVHHRLDEPDGKRFWWTGADGSKGLAGVKARDLPLYGIERLPAEGVVFVGEGEKVVDALAGLGLAAVGTVTGASSTPAPAVLADLAGRDVVLWPDADEPGRRHMGRLASRLAGVAGSVTVLDPAPERADGWDAADAVAAWRAQGLDVDAMRARIEAEETAEPMAPPAELDATGPEDWRELVAVATEGALGRLFAERYGERVRWIVGDRAFALFNGTRWERDATEAARGLLSEIVADLYKAAAGERGEDARKRIAAAAIKADRSGFQNGALTLAEPALAANVADFDAQPSLLNLANGTLDLDTGRLRPHRASDLLSRLAGGRYDESADCPLWKSCCQVWLAGDPALIAFARRLVGYLLIADCSEQRIAILTGPGANGKSVFIGALQRLLGDYATSIALDSLLESPRGRDGAHHSDDVASLAGRRAAFAVESMKGRRLDASRVKALTGGDTISARRIYSRTFSFQNTARLVLATNHLPRIDGDDYALTRRLAVVPFEVTIPEEDRDPTLDRRLAREVESGGLLNWALSGLDDWRERGLAPPEAVTRRSETYARQEDPIGRFIDAECETGPELRSTRRALATCWTLWRASEGLREVPPRGLYDALRERGFEDYKARGERGFAGIAVAEPEAAP